MLFEVVNIGEEVPSTKKVELVSGWHDSKRTTTQLIKIVFLFVQLNAFLDFDVSLADIDVDTDLDVNDFPVEQQK